MVEFDTMQQLSHTVYVCTTYASRSPHMYLVHKLMHFAHFSLPFSSFFAVLADDHLTTIVERWICERVPAGKCLFRPNSKSRHLYLILEGSVIVKPAVSKTLETESPRTIGPGNFIGFTEALNGTVRSAECRAGPAPGGVVICKLPAKLFRRFREISQSR